MCIRDRVGPCLQRGAGSVPDPNRGHHSGDLIDPAAAFETLVSLAGPIMPGPGDPIDWRLRVAVVHLKASVVQLVEEVSCWDLPPAGDPHSFETRVGWCRAGSLVEAAHQDDHWVDWYYPPEKEAVSYTHLTLPTNREV